MSQRRSYRRSGNPFGRPRHEFSLMRTLGRVIIVVIVVSAIYIVVDFSGRIWAEAYVASEVQNALGLSGKPDVTFGGPLFMPQLLSGELSSATAKMADFTSNGVAFTEATLKLEQVQFSPAKLLFHDESTIVAQTGSGTATMTGQQLTDAFQAQGIPITLFFTDEGAIRVQAAQFQGLSATVAATIEHGDLVLRPTNPELKKRISFTLDVPELVPGMTYETITFDPPFGELTFSLKDATFEVNAPSG